MNAARRAARTGRNLLIALVVGAVIIAAIVVAYVVGRSSGTTTAAPSTAAIGTDASPTTGASTDSDAAPTGCLGGSSRDAEMLLAAQKSAPHTAYGAVEVTAAFSRWAYRYPFPSKAEADEVSREVVAADASEGFKDIAASFKSAGDITNGQVERGTAFYLSTATGVWVLAPGSSSDRVTVDLNAAYVIKGVLSPTKTAAISATLIWRDGRWRLLAEQQPDTSALSAGGTQFTAGC